MQRTILRSIFTVFGAATVIMVLSAVNPSDLAAQRASLPARKVAFLHNFTKLTDWPADGGSTRVICVLGGGPVAEELSSLEGKSARGKTIVTRVISHTEDARSCHVLFVADSRIDARQIGDAPVLTVGNGDGFAQAGGMICLHEDGDRLSIDINLDVVRKHRLRLDPQLLALSRIIKTPRPTDS